MAQTPILRTVTLTAAEGDPLGRFRDGAVETGSSRSIPLAATHIRVLLTSGLAVVRTERVFRNAEAASIEATLTFPVPVHATLFQLHARIDGRVLRGAARRHVAAREAYEDAVSNADDPLPRAVAAVAATLLLPRLTEDAAAALAEAEGLCCHLTSLVLVDEAGAVQEGLPAQRKVPLMAPKAVPADSGSVHCAPLPPTEMLFPSARQFRMPASASPAKGGFGHLFRCASRASDQCAKPQDGSPPTELGISTFLRRQGNAAGLLLPADDLASVGKHIDWSANPEGLRRGKVDSLPPGVTGPLQRVAAVTEVIALSNELGFAPLVVAIALLAQSMATEDRHAARLARAVLGGTSPARLQQVLRALRL